MYRDFDFEAHYFVPMSKSGIFRDTCMIECALFPYEFDGFKYKLYAVPVNENNYGMKFYKESFYTSDFVSGVDDGFIIKKDYDGIFGFKQDKGMEKLTDSVYLVHEYLSPMTAEEFYKNMKENT